MGELDEVLRVEWSEGLAGGTGGVRHGRAEVGPGWAIGNALNGGVLMAVGAQALTQVLEPTGHQDVLTWSAFFLSAAQPGSVDVDVGVLRRGRSVSTGRVSLLQAEEGGPVERVRMTVTSADATARLEPVHRAPPAAPMPPVQECVPASRESSPLARVIALLDRMEVRVDPATSGFAVGRPSGQGVIRAWLRMADGREPDIAMLPFAVDALMPVSFDLGVPGWAPTLELTGQVLGRPAPGWLQVELTADTVVGGYYVEDARVWDSSGRLVARSRQLAGVRMPGN